MTARKSRLRWVLLGLLALIVVAVTVGLYRLDAVLTEKVQAMTAEYSAKWGRAITVEKVATRLFPRVGVRVSKASVGAAQGESRPLAELAEVSVSVDAWRAAISGGKDLQVDNAELRGLVVNVEKLKDGSTNVDRLMEKISATSEKQEEGAGEKTDLSGLQVHRAALVGGKFALIDGGKELTISDVDVEVKDLRVGRPLQVNMNAAVLAAQDNFSLTVRTSPLSAELSAVPISLTLKAQKIDLGPLGPFMGKSVGLRKGTLDADWKVELGSAAPGGSGATALKGTIAALGLVFEASEGGRSLDVKLDTDVSAKLDEGTVKLSALKLEAGPARVDGHGEVNGLLTGKPTAKGLEVTIHPFDLDELAKYYPPLRSQLGGQVGGRVGATVLAAGTESNARIAIDVDLSGARLAVRDQLSKAAGTPMKLHADLAGAAEKALDFSFDADLSGVDLRPGGQVNKPPGQPLTLTGKGRYTTAAADSKSVTLDPFSIAILDQKLQGKVSVFMGPKDALAFNVDASSRKIDANALLLDEEKPAAKAGNDEKPEPPADPKRFDGMKGDVSLRVASLSYEKMQLSDVLIVLHLVKDHLQLEKMSTGIYGGRLVADGTSLNLGPETKPFDAKLKVENVDVAAALRGRFPKDFLSGRLTGDIDLKGAGFSKEDLANSLSGALAGKLAAGALTSLDVVSEVTGMLSKVVPGTNALASTKGTSLGEVLPLGLTIENGVAKLKEGLKVETRDSTLALSGGAKLDGELALGGNVGLKQETISKLTKGKVTLKEPLPVAFKLTGPAWSPKLTDVDVKPAAQVLLTSLGRSALSNALGGKDVQAERLAREKAANLQKEAEAKISAEKARAEAAAKQEADKVRQKAEEEAKKKLKGIFGR
ncbi:MAG: AsmA family protein [Myxococcaceae bacterium]